MRRFFSLLCMFAVLATCSSCAGTSPAQDGGQTSSADRDAVQAQIDALGLSDTQGQELMRAWELGLAEDFASMEQTVTFREYFAMLDALAELAAPGEAETFADVYPDARASDGEMSRYDGMVALYTLAQRLGEDYLTLDDATWDEINGLIGEKCWDDITWNPLYGDHSGDDTPLGWTLEASAYFYSFGRLSLYSGGTLFDYDAGSNSMRTSQPLTRLEAVLSVVRLHDSARSAFPVTLRGDTEEDEAYLETAEARRQEILTSADELPDSGTVYYVSADGSDSNDGLSPETPWASIGQVNGTAMQPGDTVRFRRGDVFRGYLQTHQGVRYTAYGSGEKPRIYGSPENGAAPGKWSLWLDEGGVKIWKFHQTLQDCGGIVFNDGEQYASRVYAWWNGTEAVVWDDPETAFSVAEQLEFDLQFYCGYPADMASRSIPFTAYESDLHGEVYLRCDAGNPGEVFSSIEFQCPDEARGYAGIIQCQDNVVIDNLSVRYSNTMGIACGSSSNVLIQNCEVAFVGGGSHIIGYTDGENGYVPVSGEGIRLEGYNNRAVGNYVHDCFDGGILVEPDVTFELDDSGSGPAQQENAIGELCIEGNVIERCMSGVLVGVHCEDAYVPYVSSLRIADNDILYCGYGWSGDEHCDFTWKSADYDGNAITFWDDDYSHGPFTVEGNRLYAAKAALIHSGLTGENAPVFSGNTYAPNRNGYVVSGAETGIAYSDAQVREICGGLLHDGEARLFSVE